HPVGAGVLGDHQQFLHAGVHQAAGLAQHIADRTADQAATHGRDDAEAAIVVAAFGDLQVGVVARRQADALGRHQVDVGIVRAFVRGGLVHGAHHLFVLLGPGDGQHRRMHGTDHVGFHAQAAGDDDLAVLDDGLTDGVQRFGLGAVNEAAGIHHDDVGPFVVRTDGVAVGAQL